MALMALMVLMVLMVLMWCWCGAGVVLVWR